MSDPRVEMLSLESSLAAAEGLGIHGAIAKLNVFRVLLQRPKTAKAISDLLFSLLFEAELDHRLREFVILRIGWVTGCDYEWTQHWPIAQDMFGCESEVLLGLRDWRAADCFDERECAVLAATDELLETRNLSDESWARLSAVLDRDACIDFVAAIGTWSLISTLARGLRFPLEEGVASWPPDHRAAPTE